MNRLMKVLPSTWQDNLLSVGDKPRTKCYMRLRPGSRDDEGEQSTKSVHVDTKGEHVSLNIPVN